MSDDLRIVTIMAKVREHPNGQLDVWPVTYVARRPDECQACTPAMRLVGYSLGGSSIDPAWLLAVQSADHEEGDGEDEEAGHGSLVELRVRLGDDVVIQISDEALAAALAMSQIGCGLHAQELPPTAQDGWVDILAMGGDLAAVHVEARQSGPWR